MAIKLDNFYLFSCPVNFNIAKLKILFSHHIIVVLNEKGVRGIGEGILYHTSPLKVIELLKEKDLFLDSFINYPDLYSAVEMAYLDIEAKKGKIPLWQLIGKKLNKKIPIVEQIFIPQSKEELINQLEEINRHGTEVVKLKAGRNIRQDLKNITFIKNYFLKPIKIQLDLNQGLTLSQAIRFGLKLKSLGVDAWEEPISFSNFNTLKQLRQKIDLPIILDESIKSITDLNEAIKNKAFDILNVKIARLGGLKSCVKIVKAACQNHINIEIGCSEELGIGTAALIHLARVSPYLRAMEGLGKNRLGFDIIKNQYNIQKGLLFYHLLPHGLGIDFQESYFVKSVGSRGMTVLSKNNLDQVKYFKWYYYGQRLRNKFINGLILVKSLFSND